MTVAPITAQSRGPWLFSRNIDLLVFGGSALLALLAVVAGARLGVLSGDMPDWAWVPAVLLVDVAHVYATAFRVYFDPVELSRRPALYVMVPVAGYLAGVMAYAQGELFFWRALAYLAVFHFVRQQRGWVKLYRAKAGETGPLGSAIDAAAIYAATLYPLIWWHAHLPRAFWWFLAGDFAGIPLWVARMAWPLYLLSLAAYALRSLLAWMRGHGSPGKDLVVATTAACWYGGIVALNSDYAFTVTNVLVHGIPYLALVWAYVQQRASQRESRAMTLAGKGIWVMLATVWLGAYLEELLWDRAVWHERAWLFGQEWNLDLWKGWLVPLLALPQLVHYLLDGFLWRRKKNVFVQQLVGSP